MVDSFSVRVQHLTGKDLETREPADALLPSMSFVEISDEDDKNNVRIVRPRSHMRTHTDADNVRYTPTRTPTRMLPYRSRGNSNTTGGVSRFRRAPMAHTDLDHPRVRGRKNANDDSFIGGSDVRFDRGSKIDIDDSYTDIRRGANPTEQPLYKMYDFSAVNAIIDRQLVEYRTSHGFDQVTSPSPSLFNDIEEPSASVEGNFKQNGREEENNISTRSPLVGPDPMVEEVKGNNDNSEHIPGAMNQAEIPQSSRQRKEYNDEVSVLSTDISDDGTRVRITHKAHKGRRGHTHNEINVPAIQDTPTEKSTSPIQSSLQTKTITPISGVGSVSENMDVGKGMDIVNAKVLNDTVLDVDSRKEKDVEDKDRDKRYINNATSHTERRKSTEDWVDIQNETMQTRTSLSHVTHEDAAHNQPIVNSDKDDAHSVGPSTGMDVGVSVWKDADVNVNEGVVSDRIRHADDTIVKGNDVEESTSPDTSLMSMDGSVSSATITSLTLSMSDLSVSSLPHYPPVRLSFPNKDLQNSPPRITSPYKHMVDDFHELASRLGEHKNWFAGESDDIENLNQTHMPAPIRNSPPRSTSPYKHIVDDSHELTTRLDEHKNWSVGEIDDIESLNQTHIPAPIQRRTGTDAHAQTSEWSRRIKQLTAEGDDIEKFNLSPILTPTLAPTTTHTDTPSHASERLILSSHTTPHALPHTLHSQPEPLSPWQYTHTYATESSSQALANTGEYTSTPNASSMIERMGRDGKPYTSVLVHPDPKPHAPNVVHADISGSTAESKSVTVPHPFSPRYAHMHTNTHTPAQSSHTDNVNHSYHDSYARLGETAFQIDSTVIRDDDHEGSDVSGLSIVAESTNVNHRYNTIPAHNANILFTNDAHAQPRTEYTRTHKDVPITNTPTQTSTSNVGAHTHDESTFQDESGALSVVAESPASRTDEHSDEGVMSDPVLAPMHTNTTRVKNDNVNHAINMHNIHENMTAETDSHDHFGLNIGVNHDSDAGREQSNTQQQYIIWDESGDKNGNMDGNVGIGERVEEEDDAEIWGYKIASEGEGGGDGDHEDKADFSGISNAVEYKEYKHPKHEYEGNQLDANVSAEQPEDPLSKSFSEVQGMIETARRRLESLTALMGVN
eukprot:CFRG4549T1